MRLTDTLLDREYDVRLKRARVCVYVCIGGCEGGGGGVGVVKLMLSKNI